VAQTTASLKRISPGVKVLVLTAHEDLDYLRRLLQAGASGYVLKRAVPEELIQAIHTVATGAIYLDPILNGRVLNGYNYQLRPGVSHSESEEDEPQAELSEREREVLRLIARGYTNKEIAAQLHISVKTVETYKTRLMEKLDLRSRADIVSYALRQGWL
jgi:DNA-binding NarL/FixJ family response regulator